MTETETKINKRGPYKKRVNKTDNKAKWRSQRAMERNLLRSMILKHGLSVYEASVRCDIDECKAYNRLFDRKPTQQQIEHAFEVYDKGLSLIFACTASGVSPEHFRKLNRARQNKINKIHRW
jgi:hypothetical protein